MPKNLYKDKLKVLLFFFDLRTVTIMVQMSPQIMNLARCRTLFSGEEEINSENSQAEAGQPPSPGVCF